MRTPTTQRIAMLFACIAVVMFTSAAHALTPYNSNCAMSGCHAQVRESFTIVGQDADSAGPDGLKTFEVVPGQTASLMVDVTDGWGGTYGVAVRDANGGDINTDVQGEVTPANTLVFTPDATWDVMAGYYTTPMQAGEQTWTFDMAVDAGVEADFYLLEFIVAGKSSGRWSERETFYLQVISPRIPGDADEDGDVDLDDFVALKQNFGTGTTWDTGDFDGNGTVDLDDFVILKQNFGTAAVPEPATLSLLVAAATVAIGKRRPRIHRA